MNKEYVYAIILFGIIGFMLLIYRQDRATRKQESPLTAATHLSTASAFWFYLAAYVFLAAFWLLVWDENRIESQGVHEAYWRHIIVHVPRLMCSWLANLSLLLSAIAYSRGDGLDVGRLIKPASQAAVAMLLWVILWESVHHTESLFWTSLLIAPDLTVATVAMALLGWVFFVRWRGSLSTLYLIVATAYAILQLPLHLALELDPLLPSNTLLPTSKEVALFSEQSLKSLNLASPLLAVCHIMLSYCFLSLLVGSSAPAVNINQPRYLLRGPRELARWILPSVGGRFGGRVVEILYATAVAIVVAVLLDLLHERYGPFSQWFL
jgi:hypothetical protein